jgi:hypothetical protein
MRTMQAAWGDCLTCSYQALKKHINEARTSWAKDGYAACVGLAIRVIRRPPPARGRWGRGGAGGGGVQLNAPGKGCY